MRTLDGRLLADLNDNTEPAMTGSVEVLTTSSIDENLTSYVLLPERINAVPYISSSIFKTSIPEIKPIQFNDPDKYNMFVDQQGVVKVAVGSSFTLKIKGMQPPVYNVENGVPTQYVDQNLLTYEWQKDGAEFVSDQDASRPNSFVSRSGEYYEELNFFNISPKFAGTYVCVISNDIGSVESEQVVLEVYNPDLEDKFYSNLVDNPYGKNGTDTWNSPDIEFTTGRLSDAGFEKFSQPWNTDLFGYSIDMLYPRPYQINTHHIRNSNFTQDLMQEGYYFTRERFKYRAKDGKTVINASTDIDLSSVVEYTQGSIYGVEGIRAVFGCYIGNAISKYRTTLLNALITRRTSKYALIPSKARLDILNVLLAGVPIKSEEVRVNVQEYDNETALMSTVNGFTQPGISLVDPWTNAIYSSPGNVDIAASVPNAVNVQNDWYESKIVEVIQNNRLFPNQDFVPTFGQYAQFSRSVIDKLNFRTNKIRITISYETWINVVNVTNKEQLEASDECFEHEPWDWITLPLHWPYDAKTDFAIDPQSNYPIGVDWYNQKTFNLKDRTDVFRYATLLGPPRAMTTGFNLVLIPLETNAKTKSDYYTRTILSTIDDQYPQLRTGTSPASEVGVYMGTISDYTYEIIGVNIEHKYNKPFSNVEDKDKSADVEQAYGEVASRTTVKTYKYNKNHNVNFPEVLDFKSPIWSPYRLTSDTNFTLNTNNPEYIILYNSGSGDLLEANLEQVAGNITSNIIKYTNNLITDVPATFLTQSVFKNDFLYSYQGIGFTMKLAGEDYGVQSTASLSNSTETQFKARQLQAWQTLNKTVSTDYYYNVLQAVNQPLQPYQNSTQHIIYSNELNNRYAGTTAAAEPRVNLAGSFGFNKSNYYETTTTYEGVGLTENEAVDKTRIQRALHDRLQEVVLNGKTVDLRPYYDSVKEQRNREVVSVSFLGATSTITVPEVVVTYYYRGSTNDVVKLNEIEKNDIKTPAAVIIPSEKKVYYFIYNYIDNALKES